MHLCVKSTRIHHFADDTNLLYPCKSLTVLRKSINKDLELLYDWLCANRLSLNTGKTEFIVFRPQRYKITERVNLKMHQSKLLESPKIKYFGLILDNKLDWKGHITELSKKLSRAVGFINLGISVQPLCLDPCAIVYLIHICYMDLSSGGMPIVRISIKLNISKRSLRCIVFANYDKNVDTNSIHFDLKILNLDHQFPAQLSSLMWGYDHDVLPQSLRSHFKRANLVHAYNTRTAAKGSLHYSKVNTSKYGLKSFKYHGIKILNDLKNMSIYQTATSEFKFVRELKSD